MVALLVACLVTLAGCSGLQSSGDKGYVSADGKIEQVAAADRGDPVTLEGKDLDGKDISVADFRGKPVVVVVWGSWCSPCRAEAPGVVEAAKELDGKAQFVGLNIRDGSVDQAKGFVRTFDVPYPSVYSPDGKGMLAFAGSLPPQAIPSFAVLDDEGRVAAVIPGQLPSKTTLVELTEDVAAEGSPAGSGGNADG